MTEDELKRAIVSGVITVKLLETVILGPSPFDPVYRYHVAIRKRPFCGDLYRRHGGFADHRDRCEDGPNPGANPVR